MNDGAGSWRRHGVSIPIKFYSVQLFVSRDVWVNARTLEDVACDDCLVRQMVPQLERESWISGAEAAYEMIFECLYCAFGSIYAVIVRFNKLDGTVSFA